MPKKLEQIKKAIMRDKGKSEADAYAIATFVYNKMQKKKKKGGSRMKKKAVAKKKPAKKMAKKYGKK